MKGHAMSSHTTESVISNGAATRPVMTVISDDYLAPSTPHSTVTQATVALGMLTGLWVAISPWFLVLQRGGNNATVTNLIVGLAVVALGLYALSGSRGFLGLEVGSLLAGAWLIISPFILDAKFAIATPMYWSNIFAGALVVLIGLAALAEAQRRPTR
jgi:SPW repeat